MTALRRRSSLDRGEWLFVQDPQRAWTLGRVDRRGSRVVSLNVDGRRREARMSQVAAAGRAQGWLRVGRQLHGPCAAAARLLVSALALDRSMVRCTLSIDGPLYL